MQGQPQERGDHGWQEVSPAAALPWQCQQAGTALGSIIPCQPSGRGETQLLFAFDLSRTALKLECFEKARPSGRVKVCMEESKMFYSVCNPTMCLHPCLPQDSACSFPSNQFKNALGDKYPNVACATSGSRLALPEGPVY